MTITKSEDKISVEKFSKFMAKWSWAIALIGGVIVIVLWFMRKEEKR